jgi:hypothetical protein
MNLMVLFSLFVLNNYKSKETSGNDERYPTEEKITIKKFIENNQKKILLDYLKSDKVSIFYKIDTINIYYGNNIPKPFNLSKGGLLDDWNFDI